MDLQMFLWASLIAMASPGPNAVLIIQASIDRGTKYALAILAGAALGTVVYCLLTGFGLAALIVKNPTVFNIIKFLGCLYILYLGIMGIYNGVQVLKTSSNSAENKERIGDKSSLGALFFKGLITAILNIATLLLILSIFPQFIVNNDNVLQEWLGLSTIFVLVQLAWYTSLITLLVSLRKYMLKPIVQGGIKILTSSLLIFLAVDIFIR